MKIIGETSISSLVLSRIALISMPLQLKHKKTNWADYRGEKKREE